MTKLVSEDFVNKHYKRMYENVKADGYIKSYEVFLQETKEEREHLLNLDRTEISKVG